MYNEWNKNRGSFNNNCGRQRDNGKTSTYAGRRQADFEYFVDMGLIDCIDYLWVWNTGDMNHWQSIDFNLATTAILSIVQISRTCPSLGYDVWLFQSRIPLSVISHYILIRGRLSLGPYFSVHFKVSVWVQRCWKISCFPNACQQLFFRSMAEHCHRNIC